MKDDEIQEHKHANGAIVPMYRKGMFLYPESYPVPTDDFFYCDCGYKRKANEKSKDTTKTKE
jgi:hypothetical protein